MAWVAVPFESADLPAIGQFLKKQYTGPGTYGTMGMFQWKIIDNYIQPGFINLVKDNGEIISTTSVTPKQLFFRGRKYRVAEIGDTYTDLNYQRQGIFALLINRSTEDAVNKGMQFIYGTPNDKSLPGYEKKANYKTISGVNVKSLMIPLNIKPFIQRKSHWLIGSYAGSLFCTLVCGYFLVKRFLSGSLATEIEELETIPADWNDFWEKSREPYDFIFARDKKALIWRFFKNPNKYRFYVLKEKDQILGYLVYRIICDAEITTLLIADFLFLPGWETDLKALLFRILYDALDANVTRINAWCTRDSPYFKVFKEFGFIERVDIPIICFQNDFALTLLANSRTWHFTVSDSDNV